MKKYDIKIGIIGCGNIARIHLRTLQELVPKEYIAVCDLDEIRSEAFGEEFGIDRRFSDLGRMLIEFRPEICHVLTPPQAHATVAIQCMEQGAHVFIEKPMCTESAEADRVVAAANRTERLVCVGHQVILEERFQAAQRVLRSGELGSLVHLTLFDGRDFLERSKEGFAEQWTHGLPGGAFFDILPHLICLLYEFLPGLELQSAYYTWNQNRELTDLYAGFRSPEINAAGMLHISLVCRFWQNFARLDCTDGFMHIDTRSFVTHIIKRRRTPDAVQRLLVNAQIGSQLIRGASSNIFRVIRGRLKGYEGTDRLIRQFYDAVVQGQPSPVPAEAGRDVVALCEQVVTRAVRGLPDDVRPKKRGSPTRRRVSVKQSDARILVTGGSGFIGRRLVSRLANDGERVRVLARSLADFPDNVRVIQGDISDRALVDAAMEGIETVYHLAAAVKGNWNQHLGATVRGTKNVLDAMFARGTGKLVHVSSASVYDTTRYPNNGRIDEAFPYERHPFKRGAYANAKLRAEKLVRGYMETGKVTACIVRPGMVYGPGRPPLSVLPPRVMIRKTLLVMGTRRKDLNLVYVENLVDALIMAGNDDRSNGCIFNVEDTARVTQGEYLKSYRTLSGNGFRTVYLPIGLLECAAGVAESAIRSLYKKNLTVSYKLKSIAKNTTLSTERIETVLGWKSRIPFEAAFRASLHPQG